MFQLFPGNSVLLLQITYFRVLSTQGVRISLQVSAWAFTFPDTGSHRARNLHFLEREDISLVGLVSGTNFLRLLLFLKWQRWKEKSHSMNSTWNIFFTWIREKKLFSPSFSLIITCWIFGLAMELKNQLFTHFYYPVAYAREWLIVT